MCVCVCVCMCVCVYVCVCDGGGITWGLARKLATQSNFHCFLTGVSSSEQPRIIHNILYHTRAEIVRFLSALSRWFGLCLSTLIEWADIENTPISSSCKFCFMRLLVFPPRRCETFIQLLLLKLFRTAPKTTAPTTVMKLLPNCSETALKLL